MDVTAGVPLTTVSRHLGHENVSITVDLYGHVDRQARQAAADAMANLLAAL
jgi:integrase